MSCPTTYRSYTAGLYFQIVHKWTPCHREALKRSHVDKTIVLLKIGDGSCPSSSRPFRSSSTATRRRPPTAARWRRPRRPPDRRSHRCRCHRRCRRRCHRRCRCRRRRRRPKSKDLRFFFPSLNQSKTEIKRRKSKFCLLVWLTSYHVDVTTLKNATRWSDQWRQNVRPGRSVAWLRETQKSSQCVI